MAERSWRTTGSRAILVGAVLGGALTLLPGAHGVPAATCARDEPGQVRIRASSPRPATIRIGPGKAVTWIACDAGNRRVASTTGAWATFTLQPNRQRRIVFPRAGRYPYKVDGKTNGLVIVAVVGAATTPPGQSGQAERTVRYDIRVKADYRYRQTLDGGLVETSISYVGNWRNASVKVYDAFGTLAVTAPRLRGTIDGLLRYSDARGDTRCQGTLDYPPYPAEAVLTAGRGNGSKPYFNFSSDISNAGPYSDLTNERLNPICDDLPASDARTVWLENDFQVAQGVIVRPPGAGVGEFDAGFRRDGGAGVPFPLDRVRAWKAFTIVGQRTVTPRSCGIGCSENSTGRVEFVFTPRR